MNYPMSIPEMFRCVVAECQSLVLEELQAVESNITELNYQYGPLRELQQTLVQMKEGVTTPAKMWPLVWLIEDVTLDRSNARRYLGNTILRVVVAYPTNANWKSPEREAQTFAPILRPIYYRLLEAIEYSYHFHRQDRLSIPHRMTERKYWSADNEAANQLTTYVDAIDIEQLQLRVNFENAYTPIIYNN